MPEQYPVGDLRATADALARFIEAAKRLRDDPANESLRHEVAKAAGKAHRASEMANVVVSHRMPAVAGGHVTRVDPIKAWDSQLDPFMDPLQQAIDAAHQIHGILIAKAEAGEREERSLVGRVARLIGFPARVQTHLAERGHSRTTQSVGFWATFAAEIVAGLVVATVTILVLERLL